MGPQEGPHHPIMSVGPPPSLWSSSLSVFPEVDLLPFLFNVVRELLTPWVLAFWLKTEKLRCIYCGTQWRRDLLWSYQSLSFKTLLVNSNLYLQFESTCLLLAVPAFARWRVFECDGVQWTEAGQGSGTGGGATLCLLVPDQTVKSAEPDIHPCACGGSAGFLIQLLCFPTLWQFWLPPGQRVKQGWEAQAGLHRVKWTLWDFRHRSSLIVFRAPVKVVLVW